MASQIITINNEVLGSSDTHAPTVATFAVRRPLSYHCRFVPFFVCVCRVFFDLEGFRVSLLASR